MNTEVWPQTQKQTNKHPEHGVTTGNRESESFLPSSLLNRAQSLPSSGTETNEASQYHIPDKEGCELGALQTEKELLIQWEGREGFLEEDHTPWARKWQRGTRLASAYV